MADDEHDGEQTNDETNGGDGLEKGENPAEQPTPEPDSGAPRTGFTAWVRELWRNPASRFVLLFLPFLLVVAVGYPFFVRHYNPVIQWFILMTAKIEYLFFQALTGEARLDEKLVFFGPFAVKIIDECTGIYEMLIFSAAVLAFPTDWSRKGIGLLLGCPMIYLFNVLRIAMLIVVGRYWPSAFDFMHLYFWQATMIVMITSVWLLWIMFVVRRDEVDPPPAPA